MSSSVNGNYYSSSSNRVTGMVSGLDVDSIVKGLMDAEKQPLNKLKQKRQLSEWEQEAYRDVNNKLRSFNDKYFSYTNPSNNMLSQSTYKQFSTSSSNESVVVISADAEAKAGTHTIEVSNLATAASYKSPSSITKTITASSIANFSEAVGSSFVLNIDGAKTTITLDDSVTNMDDLQNKIDEAVGSGKIKVSDTNGDGSGYLTISKVDGSGIGTISLSSENDSSGLSALGFSSDDQLKNYLDTSDTLEEISKNLDNSFTFDSNGNIDLTINGVHFAFSKSTTLKEMISEINSSDAGVTMKYSTNSDSFSITANTTGAGNKINMSESGSTFLQDVGINNYTAGEDAIAIIDGEVVRRSSNSITLDGISYNLKSESTEKQTVSISQDTDAIYNQIKSFVDDYNSLINDMNQIISEEYDRDYPPLTDDQKDEMSEDEIASWEKKAKKGLLEDDSTLQSLLSNMRSALYESVSGVSVHLTEIGITTSSNYQDKGKLVIDENKLRNAIESNPEDVMNLFSQQSSSYSGTTKVRNLTSEQREVRNSEEGLAYRLYDIIQDSISTYTDRNGKKGSLIEKAGMEGDGSEFNNTISKQLDKYDEEIDEMIDKLDAKEDYYYEKYSYMETYINQMNSQLSSLQSYLE
ncbi:MAG: flagellar filament capping protein FliD [Bacillota bacterium]